MMADANSDVPVRAFSQLADERGTELSQIFSANFRKKPDFYTRVPGRVNLIGEHIDYCGYGVCPMALEQDMLFAVSVENEAKIRLKNMDKAFGDTEIQLQHIMEMPLGEGPPGWHEYFLCGIKGILEILPKEVSLRGMNVVVSGTIPQSAGLSSSSALVSAAALTMAHIHDLHMSKEKLANLCAECERYIGTQGGGMDQAIAFLATEGCAKLIEFAPLRSFDVKLPDGAVFVIAHSLAKLNKAATLDFNCRVVECRLAAQLIAKKKGLEWSSILTLGSLQKYLGMNLTNMIQLVEDILHGETYTKDEIILQLGTNAECLDHTSMTANTKNVVSFKLRQRALHVFNEARRVEMFYLACTEANPDLQNTLETLGKLMTESHRSLRDLYECSHPKLDELVELSREMTFGARLTGAGWGGCIVALLKPQNTHKYVQMLKKKFYARYAIQKDVVDSLLFETAPKAGACIYLNNE